MVEILKKLDWLNDIVQTAKKSEQDKDAALVILRFHMLDIAEALLSVAYTPDPVVLEVLHKLVSRSNQGMKKFGQSMADNKARAPEWIDSTVEELLDAANYLTRLKRDIS